MPPGGSTHELGRLQHRSGVSRYLSSCVLCFRELVHVAMSLTYCLVAPHYKLLPQLCDEWQQQGKASARFNFFQSAWRAPLHEQLSLSCEAPWGARQTPYHTVALPQHLPWTAAAYVKGAATQLWLQVVLGDLSVTAHLVMVMFHISTVLLLAWHSRPTARPVALSARYERKKTKLALRLLTALSHFGGSLTPHTASYHVLEMLLRDGQRLQLFAAFGWMDGWLFPVPLAWQVPLGLLEYTAFTAACSWYDARAGRPAPSWQQHLLECVIAVALPTMYAWYHTCKPGQCSPDAAVAGSGCRKDKMVPAATSMERSSKCRTSQGVSPSGSTPNCSSFLRLADRAATAARDQGGEGGESVAASDLAPQHDSSAARRPSSAAGSMGAIPQRLVLPAAAAPGTTTATPLPASKELYRYTAVTSFSVFSVKVEQADFPADAQACIAAVQQGLLSTGPQRPLSYNVVAVPGCVLLLGQMAAPVELRAAGATCSKPSRKRSTWVTAFDGSAWAVQLPLPSVGVLGSAGGAVRTEGHCVGVRFMHVQQLQQEAESGGLLEAVLDACSSSAALPYASTEAAAAPGGQPAPAVAAAGCCQQGFCAVGTWGQPVVLQLNLPAGSMLPRKNGSHSSKAVYDSIRVVLSRDSGVLLDQVLPLTAVTVASDGSARVQLQLQPSEDTCIEPAAAFCLHLVPQLPEAATVPRQLPLAQVTLLMLEEPLAAELVTWVTHRRLPVCQLSGLAGDLAVLLDTRQQLQGAWVHRQAAAGNRQPPDANNAAAALARVDLAITAADHLGPYLSASGLPLAADLVAGVKQQVLVAAARLQPPAAGRVGLLQPSGVGLPVTAAQGSSGTVFPASATATATAPARATGPCAEPGSSCKQDWRACVLAHGSSDTSSPAQTPPAECPVGVSSSISSARQDATCGGSSSKPGAAAHRPASKCSPSKVSKSVPEADQADPLLVTAAERQAVACGGWQGALLCWHGFRSRETERAYLLFKTDHLWVWDWVCQVYYLVVMLQMSYRSLKLTGQSVWPLHRVYGVHWIAEGLLRVLVMLLARSKWCRLRQMYILLYHVRTLPWLLWEAYMWPTPLLTYVRGSANKVLLFMPINLVLALAVPKVMVGSWFLLGGPFALLPLVHATPDTQGFGGWLYQWKHTGGMPLLLYCLGFTLVTFAIMMCMSVVTDLWGRQAFLKGRLHLQLQPQAA